MTTTRDALDTIAQEATKWTGAAEEWGHVAVREMILGTQARGIVRRQHFNEAARSARLAARYAIRFQKAEARFRELATQGQV